MSNSLSNKIRKLAETLQFFETSKTPYKNKDNYPFVAFNDEFVIFKKGKNIDWTSMNGFYHGSFTI